MKPQLNLGGVKRGVLFFWALWLSLVFATNALDGLKALDVLPAGWALASGNYAFLRRVTAVYQTPAWLTAALFAGVVLWEGLAALLFWHSFRVWCGVKGRGLPAFYTAFGVSLALWAAFMIAEEVFLAYPVEGTHRSLFTCTLVSLLALRLLPDE
jgi:hypothetical protein